MIAAALVVVLTLGGGGYQILAYHQEEEVRVNKNATDLEQLAGAVQKIVNSTNVAQYWEYWKLWETVGLTQRQHAHWCSIAKELNLKPCAGTLKK